MKRGFLFLLLFTCVYAQDPHWATIGAGYLKPSAPRMALSIEARSKLFLRNFRTQLGFLAERLDAVYLYGGVGFEKRLLGRIYFYPNFSPGIYFKGEGIDLGSTIEFRSSLDLFYQLCEGLRFGGNFFHISNASISSRNPGVNGVIFYLSFAFY